MTSFSFLGEESARFTRFASVCQSQGIPLRVFAMGREPLSSRPVTITGAVVDTNLTGYVRNITIQDPRTALRTRVGGSNATSSVAAKSVVFELTEFDEKTLADWGRETSTYIPRICVDGQFSAYGKLEEITNHPTQDGVQEVCAQLAADDSALALEAALTLRSFTGFINSFPRLQSQVESQIIEAAKSVTDRDIRVALIEDLGYLGGDSSKATLVHFIDNAIDDQSAWAATIALGRLPGSDVLEPLIRAASLQDTNARAAALLSLSRRVDRDNRAVLEPIFSEQLKTGAPEIFIRYGCLGLSRFSEFDAKTWTGLVEVFGNHEIPLSSRGYAALAISGAFGTSPLAVRESILAVLPDFAEIQTPNLQDYASLWALEYISELSSIVELSDLSARLYGLLSTLFEDWRSKYYSSLRAYELAEAQSRADDGMTAVFLFQQAVNTLRGIQESLPDEAAATVEFRRNVITTRLRLQAAFGDWRDMHDATSLDGLKDTFQKIRSSFQGYARGGVSLGAERRLVEREIAYIRGMSELIFVVEHLVYLDSIMRNENLADLQMVSARQVCSLAIERVNGIVGLFEAAHAVTLHRVVREVGTLLAAIERILAATDLPVPEQAGLIRQKLLVARELFGSSSWPMPGRACPIYGLGRAVLGVRRADLAGSGTADDPFLFPVGQSVLLPVYVRVVEMAPGGSSRLIVRESIGQRNVIREIPIVEDEYPIPLTLEDSDLTYRQPVHVSAHFESRDCTQAADERIFHIAAKI
ncbi:MAG: hypothetical protein QOE96_1377 [Blastocatellia bacterium]|jgi:hypothetical protein|nr:hypothetical protein [Blastocatellia bacterium]